MPESAVASEQPHQDTSQDTRQDAGQPASPPRQRWRAPAIVPLKALVSAAAGIVIAAVFFPLWAAIPVAAALAIWGLGLCVRRPSVLLDGESGQLTARLGLVTRRVPVSQIEAVVLDQGKVSIGTTGKTVVSFYAWRKSRLDAWLKVPDVASDVAHAISRAAAAQPKEVTDSPAGRTGAAGRSGKNSPLIFLVCAGVAEIAAAIVTRVSWGGVAMTAAGIVVALAFGFTGVFTLVFALWTFLTGQRRHR